MTRPLDELERLFNGIVRDYSERLYWHVRRFVHSHEDADDIVQDIFLKIWTALPSYRGEAQLFTWIYRIATNETLNWLRKRRVRAVLSFQSLDEEMERRIDEDPWFDGDALQRQLSKQIQKLPDRQRSIFILRYYEDMKYEDIAEVLGVSVGSLKASYHIAYEKIKSAVKDLD